MNNVPGPKISSSSIIIFGSGQCQKLPQSTLDHLVPPKPQINIHGSKIDNLKLHWVILYPQNPLDYFSSKLTCLKSVSFLSDHQQ